LGLLVGLKGENQNGSKLNWTLVCKIREEYYSIKITYRELAKKYNVHCGTIGDIIRRLTWNYKENPNAT
jgi:Mor family transcriptional regulator